MQESPVLKTKEAAEFLGYDVQTFRKQVKHTSLFKKHVVEIKHTKNAKPLYDKKQLQDYHNARISH